MEINQEFVTRVKSLSNTLKGSFETLSSIKV